MSGLCIDNECFKVAKAKGMCLNHYKKTLPKKPISQEQAIKNRLSGIRTRAKKKGVPFDLEVEDMMVVINSPCFYCNALPKSELDRKVPADGYTKRNLVPACHRCNTLKNEVITWEDMLKVSEILGWRTFNV